MPSQRTQGCCRHCQRLHALGARKLCGRCYRIPAIRNSYETAIAWPGKRTGKRAQDADDKGANMTTEEVNAMEAEQRLCLPWWWRAETVRESRQTQSLGRAAEVIRTQTHWVKRKSRKI